MQKNCHFAIQKLVSVGQKKQHHSQQFSSLPLKPSTATILLLQNKINFAKTGVMVQCVCPNFVDTNLIRFGSSSLIHLTLIVMVMVMVHYVQCTVIKFNRSGFFRVPYD